MGREQTCTAENKLAQIIRNIAHWMQAIKLVVSKMSNLMHQAALTVASINMFPSLSPFVSLVIKQFVSTSAVTLMDPIL